MGKSYRHKVQRIAHDHYRVSWVVDFYYPSSRLRHPRSFARDTDAIGALKFVHRWNCKMPEEKATTPP